MSTPGPARRNGGRGVTSGGVTPPSVAPTDLSQGTFVVMTLETSSLLDVPASRGDQLLAALDCMTGKSGGKDRIDASRLAVMGHSTGGGGPALGGRRGFRPPTVVTPPAVADTPRGVSPARLVRASAVSADAPPNTGDGKIDLPAADVAAPNRNFSQRNFLARPKDGGSPPNGAEISNTERTFPT